MRVIDWFRSPDFSEDKIREAEEKLRKAELTDEEVRQLLAELDRERKRNHYAEMVVGALIPRGSD